MNLKKDQNKQNVCFYNCRLVNLFKIDVLYISINSKHPVVDCNLNSKWLCFLNDWRSHILSLLIIISIFLFYFFTKRWFVESVSKSAERKFRAYFHRAA